MKKILKIMLILFVMVSVCACGKDVTSGEIPKEEYDEVVSERDELKKDYDELLDEYALLKAETKVNEIKEEINTTQKESEVSEKKVYLKKDEIDKAYSDPESASGKFIKISGQVFGEPEKDENNIYFQMYADPKNQGKNTVVVFNENNIDVNSDDYVIVKGEIQGAFDYENAFGGQLSALQINATSVKKSSYAEAVDPAEKVVEPNIPIQQYGYTINVEKVEFTSKETRVYVKITNGGSDKFYFYDFNTKIIQNGKQYECEYNYSADYTEIQSELLKGAETSGIIAFPAVDPNSQFQIYCEAHSDNWEEDFQPFIFDITP